MFASLKHFLRSIGAQIVLNTKFARDVSLFESYQEFQRVWNIQKTGVASECGTKPHKKMISRKRKPANPDPSAPNVDGDIKHVSDFQDNPEFPIISSSCPGWICYAEKKHAGILSKVSRVKSPQQITGSVV